MGFSGKLQARLFAVGGSIAVALLATALLTGRHEPMPDFREFEAGPERKNAFFAFVRPLVDAANANILDDRRRLAALADSDDVGWLDRRWLRGLAEDYALAVSREDGSAIPPGELVETLLRRVDVVPVSLALAQAAKESGWGTSRFAREGNNLFGEWCFEEGCGIVPNARAPGRRHEVRSFESPQASVESYLRNINTHPGYRSLRGARKTQRETRKDLSGVALARELSQYSERREDYVSEVRNLIISNDLEGPAAESGALSRGADGS